MNNAKLHGKTTATVVAWFLGVGVTLSWNSVLTVGDYYYQLFPNYHPGRVLALVSQPFSLATSALYSCFASKVVDAREKTNPVRLHAFQVELIRPLIDWATSGKGGFGSYVAICSLGNLLVSFLLTGIFSGACLDLLWSLVK